jgi:hypothetical protein
MERFYISFCYPFGEVITNGDVYLSYLDRYSYKGIEIRFNENLDKANFYSSLNLKILVRYLNLKFKKGIDKNLINS